MADWDWFDRAVFGVLAVCGVVFVVLLVLGFAVYFREAAPWGGRFVPVLIGAGVGTVGSMAWFAGRGFL